MKCHKCQVDNLLKDRSNGRCGRCQHVIVFDPRRTGDKFNDIQFKKALDQISLFGSLKFTREQFYFFMNKRKFSVAGAITPFGCSGIIGLLLLMFVVAGFFGINGIWLLLFYVLVVIPLAYLQTVRAAQELKFSRYVTDDYLIRWENTNGIVSSVLPEPEKSIPTITKVPEEILDYSFDRLIVTQTDDIAHFLIANNFHFENNCAVLSINQYPLTLFHTVMQMLRNNENLKVYALHDASWTGVRMLDKLRRDKLWFGEQPGAEIIDIGLMPRQFDKRKPLKLPAEPEELIAFNDISSGVKQTLTEKETKWLNKNVVSLSSIAPQSLLRMISLAIAASRDPNRKNELVPADSDYSDGGIYIFSSDSFG